MWVSEEENLTWCWDYLLNLPTICSLMWEAPRPRSPPFPPLIAFFTWSSCISAPNIDPITLIWYWISSQVECSCTKSLTRQIALQSELGNLTIVGYQISTDRATPMLKISQTSSRCPSNSIPTVKLSSTVIFLVSLMFSWHEIVQVVHRHV